MTRGSSSASGDPQEAPTRRNQLEITSVSKSYGGNHALRDASFGAAPGAIHALVGANGSGKSTLIKILAGVEHADSGEIRLGEETHDASSITPSKARQAGVRVVHQQDTVLPDLTVAENLAIGSGFERTKFGRIRWRRQRQHAKQVLERFQIDASPSEELGAIRPATQAMIAIARALQDQESTSEGLLILDEPTAALPQEEATILFDALQRCAEAGQAILFVSHRLDEVLNHSDTITILRDGAVLGTWDAKEMTHSRLAEYIAGRSLENMEESLNRPTRPTAPILLEASGLFGERIRDVSFSLAAGEVLGIGGLLGSGRSTLLRLLFGLAPLKAGELKLNGIPITLASARAAMSLGFAYVPEDRLQEAAFPDLSVAENLSIAALDAYTRGPRLQHRREEADSNQLLQDYGIVCSDIDNPFMSLSGGNQQKVVLARWIRRSPTVLLLDEPTHGVDVGARADIYSLINGVTSHGSAVILVSSDAEELELMCDRLLVLVDGRVAGSLSTDEVDDVTIEHLTGSAS
jgi:ribose transport system ATP-binding protein